MTSIAISRDNADVRSARRFVVRAISLRLPALSRGLLGFVFVLAGLNGFLNFMPAPTSMPKGALDFMMAMMQTGYFFKLLAATQLLAGALLLANQYVPLALLLLAPVIVNIVAFHVFLLPSGIVMAAVVFALEVHLAIVYRAAYRSVLAARLSPHAQPHAQAQAR